MILQRPDLEARERQTLAPYALLSAESRGRAHPEPESATRTAFTRDRDRIIHTTAFRRLEYKTQVFVFYEGDHYRTRLTHTLEVAQLGRALAQGLGANDTLTEAICLAHDLGHAPFGHAGEYALDELMTGYGGFNHNTQSYRIVTFLERRFPDFDGLNLTYETRQGMIKHETAYDKSDASGYEPDLRGSVEAQIANLADEIAYNAHDLDDGLRAGLFTVDELSGLSLWQTLCDSVGWAPPAPFTALERRGIVRELIGLSVTDVLAQTDSNLTANELDTPQKVQAHDGNVVAYTTHFGEQVAELKAFLYQNMYRHYRLMRMQNKAENFISAIFEAYIKQPQMLPELTQKRLDESPLHRMVADYIAGMTDRYALDEWQKLFDPYHRA